jgi:tetratricopeptide (TPR) repeat protein
VRDAKAFARMAAQLEAEREAARPWVAGILAAPEEALDAPMPQEWRTVGMVSALCEAAREEVVRSPQRSLLIAQLASAIAEALPPSYPRVTRAQMQAHAWKAVSNAHRFQSRYDAALMALDLADQRIAKESALSYDRAVLALARATTLRELDRFPEALRLLDQAGEVFRSHGQERHVAQCELVRGMIHYRCRDLVTAREAYLRVIDAARAAGDLHTVAAAYNNLGRAAAEAGDVSAAADALQQARAIFRELNMPTEIARVTWSIGAAQLVAGRYYQAIAILQEVRGELASLGMIEEAGLAGVDLIEALLATDARAAARKMAVAVLEEFRNAGLNERALYAVAYLRETAPVATPAAARHVGLYLRRLKEEPALLFIEPEL